MASRSTTSSRSAPSAYSPLSLSGFDSDGETDPLETIGAPDRSFEDFERRAGLAPALAALSEREQAILRMRFADGLRQTEIAERVGVSQMHVSRLIRRSLLAMRAELSSA